MSEEKKSNKGIAIGCLTLFVIVFGGGALLLGYIYNLGDKAQQSGKTLDTVVSGDVAILTQDVLLPLSDDAEKRMYRNASNGEVIRQMIADGELVRVNEGTEVYVIDRGLARSEIEVVSSKVHGYIASEYLRKK